jgi:hypothetical protein
MKLFLTELSRFWSRRITKITILVVVAVLMFGVGVAFFQHDKNFDSGSAKEQAIQDCISNYENVDFQPAPVPEESSELPTTTTFDAVKVCNEGEYRPYAKGLDRRFHFTEVLKIDYGRGLEGEPPTEAVVNGEVRAETSGYVTSNGEEVRRAEFGLDGILGDLAFPFILVMVVLGSSFIGAEYRHGTLENLLLWEPRRFKVYVTKSCRFFVWCIVDSTSNVILYLSALSTSNI